MKFSASPWCRRQPCCFVPKFCPCNDVNVADRNDGNGIGGCRRWRATNVHNERMTDNTTSRHTARDCLQMPMPTVCQADRHKSDSCCLSLCWTATPFSWFHWPLWHQNITTEPLQEISTVMNKKKKISVQNQSPPDLSLAFQASTYWTQLSWDIFALSAGSFKTLYLQQTRHIYLQSVYFMI